MGTAVAGYFVDFAYATCADGREDLVGKVLIDSTPSQGGTLDSCS